MQCIERKKYLDELVSLRHNGMIKIITGMRRCGDSYTEWCEGVFPPAGCLPSLTFLSLTL